MPPSIFNFLKPKAAKSSPQHSRFEQARLLSQQKQFAEAAAICEKILELQPAHIDSLVLLAEMAASTSDPGRAIGLYAKVIVIQPDHATAYYKRGNLLKDHN